MEEKQTVGFMRLLSDESVRSSASDSSCEYYQTEIFDQLPSIQACRPQHNRQDLLEAPGAQQGRTESGEGPGNGPLSRGPRDKGSMQPLRNMPLCIQAKRGARIRRRMQISNIGFWDSWRRSQSIHRRRVWAQMGGALSGLLPWKHTLSAIEGRFGVGVKAYFVFLRYLLYLNVLHCALIWGFILGPTTFYGRGNYSETWRFGGNDSVLDFFQGTGYMARSPVFFGFYTRGSLDLPCLNTPLLYFVGILIILFLSLIMVVRRTTVGFKHRWMLGRRYRKNVSYKIFCGWDFTIQDPDSATLKHSCIRNDLKMQPKLEKYPESADLCQLLLEEQIFYLREAQRTLGQRTRLYLLRFVLNVLVLSLLGGAFYLIFFATSLSQNESGHHWLVGLFLQYLPPITITFVNLLLPHFFRKISSFEDYSFTAQVNATLVRSIFLKLASLGMYLFFIFNAPTQQCRENQFGRDMYKLSIFNFLATFCKAFLLNYPRRLVQECFPTSPCARLLGKQHFQIPFNVLDLVYSQTVAWVGVYYCPLLPLIGAVTLVATFYVKKFTVLRCCVAEQRMFRASTSSVLFHFMLLLGLLMAAAALGFNLYQQEAAQDHMSWCGPSAHGATVFNVTGVCVESLPGLAQSTLRYLASEAFALPLILAQIIILTSYVSRVRANQKAIERLKDMLVMSSSDKRFLVKQHTTMLRTQRERHRCERGRRPAQSQGRAPSTSMNRE